MATVSAPQTIKTYADLKQAIQSVLNRSDEEFVEALDLIITMAEARIYRELRCPANEYRFNHDGYNGGRVAIPNNFLELRSVYRNGYPQPRMTEDEYMIAQARPSSRHTGFARTGAEFDFMPPLATDRPLGAEVVTVTYYADWSRTDNDDSKTNPVLVGQPDLYLTSCLIDACDFTENIDRMAGYVSLFGQKMKYIAQMARNADQSGGDLVIRGGY